MGISDGGSRNSTACSLIPMRATAAAAVTRRIVAGCCPSPSVMLRAGLSCVALDAAHETAQVRGSIADSQLLRWNAHQHSAKSPLLTLPPRGEWGRHSGSGQRRRPPPGALRPSFLLRLAWRSIGCANPCSAPSSPSRSRVFCRPFAFAFPERAIGGADRLPKPQLRLEILPSGIRSRGHMSQASISPANR